IPAWLNEETLARTPDDPGARLLELRPDGAVHYGWADLLPGARRQLVRALVKEALAELRDQAEDFHQLTRSPAGEVALPEGWAEIFLHQAAAEAVFSRLLSPGPGQLDAEALAEFVGQGWLRGPAQFQAALRESGEVFLAEAGRGLAEGRPPRPILTGLVKFLKIAAGGLGLDLWSAQNRWWDLARDAKFMGRLDPEERELMRELGLALGFSKLTPGQG
ncbi:MAG: hypothetical protein LBV70_06155, partial [Candidatus Adiutrix sp.]|nr:hypothetical protein [Candidatus Adiutrix sp.]